MQNQRKLVPFRFAARERYRFVDSRAYVSGGDASPIKLPEVGFLSYIDIVLTGVFNLSGAGTLTDRGAWNLLKRIKVDVNLGSSNIVDISGFGAYLVSAELQRGAALDGGGNATPSPLVYSVPTSAGNQNWTLTYRIPISANRTSEFEVGLINLQAPEIQCNVGLTFGTSADAVSAGAGTGFTGTASVYYGYFEVPDPSIVQWPAAQIVRTIEDLLPIQVTGDYTWYQVLRQGYLLNLIQVVQANGALTNSFDNTAVRVNKNDTVYVLNKNTAAMRTYLYNSNVSPTGVVNWGLWGAMGNPSEGDTRDGYNTERVTTLEFGVQVSSGTTLGSGNNFLQNIRRVMVNLV